MVNVNEICVTQTSDTNIKFEEKKRSILFHNKNNHKCSKVVVDGCAIKDGIKCDNLLVDMVTNNEFFVELKGEDVNHAISQLERSISLLSDKTILNKKVFAFIIPTNVSPTLNTRIQIQKKKFKKKGITLQIKEKRLIVSL